MSFAVTLLRRGLNLFRGKAVKQAAKTFADTVKQAPKTLWMVDPNTGVLRMERDIIRKSTGQVAKATTQVEQLGKGKVKVTTRIDGGGDNWIERVKTVTTEEAASIFGGKKITIEKNKTKYWCYGEQSKMVKEYSPVRGLEHIDYQMSHQAGNGLSAYKHTGTFDRIYDNCPISASADEMLKHPDKFDHVKHSLDGNNNYYKFADRDATNYSRAAEAKKQAAIAAIKKAEEEALAAKAAAEKAAAELAAKRPRMSVGKLLRGVNIEELRVIEKQCPDGAVKRFYFMKGNNKPVIKTYDRGILHQEWFYNGKQDVVYMKQVGKEEPYIYARRGAHTQLHREYIERSLKDELHYGIRHTIDEQLYYDGGTALQRPAYKGSLTQGIVKVFDKDAAKVRAEQPVIAKYKLDYPVYRVAGNRVEPGLYRNHGYTYTESLANNKADSVTKEMDDELLDFEALFQPYKI